MVNSVQPIERKPVPAVDRTLRILRALATGPLRLTDLSTRLQLPKSTTLAILRTLQRHDAVALDPATGRYRPGTMLVALGAGAQAQSDLRRVAQPALQRLAETTGETVILHVPDGFASIILDRIESPDRLRVTAPLGLRLPPFAGSVTKAVLATLSEAEAARSLSRVRLPHFTPQTVTGHSAYLRDVAAARRRGFAVDDQEYLPGVRAVSAPIRGAQGEAVGTLSVVGVASRMSRAVLHRVGLRTGRAAEQVSAALRGADSDSVPTPRRAHRVAVRARRRLRGAP